MGYACFSGKNMSLVLVDSEDITVGKPLSWSLYSEDYALLLSEGDIVHDEKQREDLLHKGVYRELAWETSTSTEAESSPAEPESAEAPFTFDDIRLKVGDRLQLEPPSQLSHERFTVKVIGYLKGISILVTTPIASNGLRLLLKESDKVILRSFSGMNAFAFASIINHIYTYPYSYLHLSFPETLQGIKIRNTPRIKTNIVAAVQNSSSPQPLQVSAVISDINASGTSLVSKQSLGNKGDVIHMAFRVQLHNVETFLSLNGIIRTTTSDNELDVKNKGYIHHGVEIQNLEPNDYVVLQSYIYQQMIENPDRVI